MASSVAVLSDIHGVLPALDAVLAEPDVKQADRNPVTLTVDGFGQVVFCHATPRDDQEVVVVDSRLDRWAEVLAGLAAEVMTVVCGHTHMPFIRLANRRQIIKEQSSYPDVAEWADYFLHARASDADALAVMAPRDGRGHD